MNFQKIYIFLKELFLGNFFLSKEKNFSEIIFFHKKIIFPEIFFDQKMLFRKFINNYRYLLKKKSIIFRKKNRFFRKKNTEKIDLKFIYSWINQVFLYKNT